MQTSVAFFSVIGYMVKAVALISTGIIIVNILGETGIFSKLTKISRPLGKVSGLSEGAVLSVISMAVNATAGKSMLAEYFREKKVEKDEIVPTLLIGTFPTVLGESLFRVQLPTAIILLGPVIGLIYTFFNLFSAFLQAFCAILYNHLFLKKKCCMNNYSIEAENSKKDEIIIKKISKQTINAGIKKSFPSLRKIIPVTVISMFVFYILSLTGILGYVALAFDPLLSIIGLPGESTAALVAQFMHFSAGYTIVGSLVQTGVLSMEQAIVTLILGSMVVITMIYIKYSLPLYLALFGRKGFVIGYKTYALSMAAKVFCIGIVMMIF